MDHFFPLEVSVLSSDALSNYISREYFSKASLNCRLFSRGLHDTYKVIANNNEYFFKVYRQGMRSLAEIQSEIDLLIHLKSLDIKISIPVSKHDGTFISHFNSVNGIRYGVLYTSVGILDFNQLEETAELNESLGRYIASIHNAWDSCDFGINRWVAM